MIYLFLAKGFEEIEALATVDILRRAELELSTVGVGGRQVTGAHGITVQTDLTEEEALTNGSVPSQLQMAILPGGMPGTLNLEKSDAVRASLQFCFENSRYLAAICAAPSILGHMGFLHGRTATCFPGFEQELLGARTVQESVCVDEKIITGNGPGAAIPFALKIVELLCGKELSEKLRSSMQCR